MGIDIICSIFSIIGFIGIGLLIALLIISIKEDVQEDDAEEDAAWSEFVLKTKKYNEDFKLQQEEFMEKFNAQTPIIFAEREKEYQAEKARNALKSLSNKDAEQELREFEDLCKRIKESCDSLLETCNDINKQNKK